MSSAALLLVLLLPRVTRAEPTPQRHLVISELPSGREAEIRIAADVPTVVRFESELDPAGTRLQAQGPSPFEWLVVSGRLLLLHPPTSTWLWPRLPLRVRLADGTSLSFALVPSPPALADVQVDVFLHPATPGALRVTLEKVSAEYEALKLEHARSQAELERYRDDEFNPDVSIAVLLLDDEASRYLVRGSPVLAGSEDVLAQAWCVRLAGRSACVILVTNRHRKKSWTLKQLLLLNSRTQELLPVVVRARPSTIPPGGSGRVVLVTRTPSSADKDLYSFHLVAPDGPEWQIRYLDMKL